MNEHCILYPDAPPVAHPMIIGNTMMKRGFGRAATKLILGHVGPVSRKLAPNMRVDIQPEIVIAEYRRLYPHYGQRRLVCRNYRGRSWRGAVIEAEERAVGSPAYAYQLDGPRQGRRQIRAPRLISSLLRQLDKPGATATGPTSADGRSNERNVYRICSHGNRNNKQIPQWEKYTLPEERLWSSTCRSHLENDPRGAGRRLLPACLWDLASLRVRNKGGN